MIARKVLEDLFPDIHEYLAHTRTAPYGRVSCMPETFTHSLIFIMDNNSPRGQEDRIMKILAILGFLVAALFIAWLAIQIIRFIPTAFMSLASLADGVNGRNGSALEVAVSESVVSTGTVALISWTDLSKDGTYAFSYECVGGVSLDVRVGTNGIVPVECDEPYALPQGTFSIEALFASERDRFVDVPFTIVFHPANERDEDIREGARSLTVVNPSIPLVRDESTPEVAVEDDEDEDETYEEDDISLGAPLPYTGFEPEEEAVDGYVELAIAYMDVGTLRGSSFTPAHTIGEDGAFRFKVTNTGTKTSGTWHFSATLTNGTGYESGAEDALAPGESIIVTVAFDSNGAHGIQKFGATIESGNDIDVSNNSFTRSVAVSR